MPQFSCSGLDALFPRLLPDVFVQVFSFLADIMSLQYGKLCSLILSEFFGETVEKVARDLYRAGQKPLKLILASTNLSREEVRQSLCILIKYGLVSFLPGSIPTVPEYQLQTDNILVLLRYPKYLMLMKTLYGDDAESLVEEICKKGINSMPKIILGAYKRITVDDESRKEKNLTLQRLRDTFELLVNKQYLQRCPKALEKNSIPDFVNEAEMQFQPVRIDINKLFEALNDDSITFNDNILWEVNYERFHQDIRDDLLATAMARRFPTGGGDVMRLMLHQMQLNSNPWAGVSNPIMLSEISDASKASKLDPHISKYLDEFLAVMAGDVNKFLTKADSSSIGYHVNLKKAVEEITWCVLANGVDARFGSSAARIFRLIRDQKFIEQEEIQKKGMLPDKEAKFLTYSLLQSGWIQQHELKKGLPKAGPMKTFFLFYINVDQVVRMYIEMCYKGLYNAIIRREHEKTENKCLLDKKQRIDAIALHMKKEGATDEQIAEIEEMVTPPEITLLETIHQKVNKLSQAELQIDETLFILQLYLRFQNS